MNCEQALDKFIAEHPNYNNLSRMEKTAFVFGFLDGWEAAIEHREQADSRALAVLRESAGVVIEQADRDAAIGLGRSQFSRLDLYEVVLTSEQVEALRVALAEGGEG